MATNEKWEKLYEAIERIQGEYGTTIISEPSKVRGLILDFAPMIANEAKAFANVLSVQDIVRYISGDGDIHAEYLVSKIEDNMGLSAEWSEKIAYGLLMLVGKTVEKRSKFNKTIETEITPLDTSTIATSAELKTKAVNTQTYEQRLISSGFSRLSNKLWDRAKEDFETALRTSSYPRAYVGLMMSTLHIRVEKEIPLCDSAIEEDPNWKKAMKYATGSYKDKLQRYAREHRRLISEKKKRSLISNSQKTNLTKNSTTTQPTKTTSKQVNTKQAKNDVSTLGMITFFLGLAVVLASFVFGIYGWFAETGLSWIMYYLILIGGSVSGLLITCFEGFRSSKEDVIESLQFAAIYGIAVPVVVTIIGLIGNLIKWLINLI